MKKRIGAVLLAGVLLLSMTGCGNNKAKHYSKYVELGEYKGIEYTKNVEEVTDEQVQSQLDSFVSGLTEQVAVTDRAVKDGDIVNIDYVGTMDGEAFEGGTAQGQDLTIGSNSFIDGFESGLIGHKIGEEVELNISFPEEYPNSPDLAGKPVTFTVTINSITEEKVPELTDALVKDNTDYDTVDAYKKSVKEELVASAEENALMEAENYVLDIILQNSKVTGFDEEEVTRLIDEEYTNFKRTAENYATYGYSYEDVLAANGYENDDDLKEGIKEYVEQHLKEKMVLYMIADKEGIKIGSEEIDAKVKEFMEMYQIQNEQEIYDYFGEDYFEMNLLSEKVLKFLMENAVLVDSIEETTEAATEETETTEAK